MNICCQLLKRRKYLKGDVELQILETQLIFSLFAGVKFLPTKMSSGLIERAYYIRKRPILLMF